MVLPLVIVAASKSISAALSTISEVGFSTRTWMVSSPVKLFFVKSGAKPELVVVWNGKFRQTLRHAKRKPDTGQGPPIERFVSFLPSVLSISAVESDDCST